jgi:ornithine cyclodeaminase/alanine dehydrogenase-like protein (mu-crystallin family)
MQNRFNLKRGVPQRREKRLGNGVKNLSGSGDIPRFFRYLSRKDVEAVGVPMDRIIAAVEEMFREKGEGRTEMPPKPGIHPRPDSFIHAMPAFIPGLKSAGIKWVSGYPENVGKGLPYISGLIILNDPETGMPIALMDCTWITAKRTGAVTAVAAKYLARPNSKIVGILGCGVQGRSNLEALRVLFPIERVMAYDTRPEAGEVYAKEMSLKLGVDVRSVKSPREAVSGCDIVVTAGPILKIPHATIQPGWLEEGAFASLVDYDSYWDRAALRQADKFCTDDVAQLEYTKTTGYFQDIPPIYAELGDLVTGRRPGRETARERTIACNLGLALDDMATAPLVLKLAVEKGLGTRFPL